MAKRRGKKPKAAPKDEAGTTTRAHGAKGANILALVASNGHKTSSRLARRQVRAKN